MTFDNIPLYEAIFRAWGREDARGRPYIENPRAEHWGTKRESRDKLARAIRDEMDVDDGGKFRMDDMITEWIAFHKTANGKAALTVETGLTHGWQCYYKNRGNGPCSNEIHLDHVIPRSKGGQDIVEHLQISCGTHNTERGNKAIEDYLGGTP